MSIISDSFQSLWNTIQKEKENLQDYTWNFKTSKDILESHIGGPIQLTKYVKIVCNKWKWNRGLLQKVIRAAIQILHLENASQDN